MRLEKTILFASVLSAWILLPIGARAEAVVPAMRLMAEPAAFQVAAPATSMDNVGSGPAHPQHELGIPGGVVMSDGDDHGSKGDKGNGGGDDNHGGGGNNNRGSGGSDNHGSGDDRGNGNSGVTNGSGNIGSGHDNNQSSENEDRLEIEAGAQAFVGGFEAGLKARFESKGNRVRLRVEVESLDLPAGAVLNVCIAGQKAGTITIIGSHAGELELDSEHGDMIPAAQIGDTVEVRQDSCASTTQPILAAQFGGGAIPGVPVARLEAKANGVIQGFEAELTTTFQDLGNRKRLSVEVVNLNLTVGTALNFCLADSSIGKGSLDAAHTLELNLDSQAGNPIPAVKAGDVIEVRADACGSSTPPLLAARFGGGPVPGVPAVLLEGRMEKIIAGFNAELRVRFQLLNTRMRFSAEVENLNLGVGTILSVCSDGVSLGTLTVDVNHLGELNLDSQAGAGVPLMNPGTTIEIRQGSCSDMSAALLAATLR